jgi:tetratricopeptide (TPR) repeat protein
MYKIIIIVFIFLQISLAEDWIDENIELTINGNFNKALLLLEKRIENNPADFRSYFYLAATLNSKMTHYENLKFENEFNSAIENTISLLNLTQKENIFIPDSTKALRLFYLGSAYGYRGFFEGKKGNWYPALSNGLKAIDLLEQAIELDSTLLKAYVGIGTYDYWSSSKIKFALWLPFIPDNREKGIEMIKKSIAEKSPARYIAMHQLVYILIDYERYDKAQIYADLIIKKYPKSQFMWWAYSHVFYKMRNYEKAISAYKYLLNLIQNDNETHTVHIIKCNLKLAQLYFESEKYSECLFHCNNILKNKNIISFSEQLEDEILEAQEYFELSNENITNE